MHMFGTLTQEQTAVLHPKYPYKALVKVKKQSVNKYFST